MRPLALMASALRRGLTCVVGERGAPLGERVVRLVTAALVVSGFLLRARGYLWHASAFWLDECTWAMFTVEQPLADLAIRPIGFMWVSRFLATTIALTEPVLRFVPWVAGLTTVAISPALARRLYVNSGARLLFVAIMALHPAAIDFSKEYKPYSCSLLLHLALVLLTLRYVDTRRPRDLAFLLVAATLGGLFAQDLIFAYPGVFLVAGYTALRERRRQLLPIVGVAGLIILLVLAQYYLSWNKTAASDRDVWAAKYNVFYNGRHSYAAWLFERHLGMATFPAFREKFWLVPWLDARTLDLLRSLDDAVWLCLHVLGIVVLLLWRRQRAVLLLLPLTVVWSFNFLRLWPIGAFRTNLFVVGYVSAIACMALDLPKSAFAKLGDLVPALVLVIAPFVVLDPTWSARKEALTHPSEFPRLLKTLIRAKLATDGPAREPLVLDRRSCDPFRYYTQFHPRVSKQLKRAFDRSFETTCVKEEARYRRALLRVMPQAPRHAWTILHNWRAVEAMIHRHQLGPLEVAHDERIGPHAIMALAHPAQDGARQDAPATEGEPLPPEEPSDDGVIGGF
ncbi:MAG TPA: glycosyltransferase family 39 protein [Polyangiaceae bacterium]|nr:glycosyltransferase family 39 protein [Polyangiaceae bacterium]